MIEYTSSGSTVFGIFALVSVLLATILAVGKAIHENRKTIAPYIGLPVAAVIVANILTEPISIKKTIQTNIALFEKGKELKCQTLGTTYLVSKQTGWKLHKDSFLKDSILVDARYCKE
jgi:hypothetical protein